MVVLMRMSGGTDILMGMAMIVPAVPDRVQTIPQHARRAIGQQQQPDDHAVSAMPIFSVIFAQESHVLPSYTLQIQLAIDLQMNCK